MVVSVGTRQVSWPAPLFISCFNFSTSWLILNLAILIVLQLDWQNILSRFYLKTIFSPSRPSLPFFFNKTKQNNPNFDLGAWEILICTLFKMMVDKGDFPVLAIPCHHRHGMPIPQYLREVCPSMNWHTVAFSHSHTTEFTQGPSGGHGSCGLISLSKERLRQILWPVCSLV